MVRRREDMDLGARPVAELGGVAIVVCLGDDGRVRVVGWLWAVGCVRLMK